MSLFARVRARHFMIKRLIEVQKIDKLRIIIKKKKEAKREKN